MKTVDPRFPGARLAPVTWAMIVPYSDAVWLLSTQGDNARAGLDAMTPEQCDSEAAGAWACNETHRYVAYRSAAAFKRSPAVAAEREMARRLCYRPIPGWSFERIAEHRAFYGTSSPRLMPVATASGVVAWAVPDAVTPPAGLVADRLRAAAEGRQAALKTRDAIHLHDAYRSLLAARALRLTGRESGPEARAATEGYADDLHQRIWNRMLDIVEPQRKAA